MLNFEQKFIIDFFSNNENINLNNKISISQERLLDLLIKHRVFLVFYDRLKDDSLFKINNKFKLTNFQIRKKKSNYYCFLKEFVTLLNNIKVDYVLLKGIANEIIIYGDLYTRMYGDIDVIINESDQEFLLNELKKNKYDFTVTEYTDYYSHEILIKIKYEAENYLIELKRRHRESKFDYTKYYLLNKRIIEWQNLNISVLNNEALLISSAIYIYNYIERIAGWLSSRKIRFCYFLDFYNFIKKYNNVINYDEVIRESIKQENIHKIILVFQHIYKIFNDDLILNIYLKLRLQYNNYKHIDYYDIGRINWNISIQNRIFNYDDVAKIVQNYLCGKFFINDKLLLEDQQNEICSITNDIRFFYNISLSHNYLKLILNDVNIPKNGEYVIYVSLYCYNKYGDYIAPYLPISIRLLNEEIKVISRFTVDFSSNRYRYEAEQLMPYQDINDIKVIQGNKNIELLIDLKKFGIILRSIDEFRYQIELIHINKDDTIYVLARTNDEKDLPLIFN